MQMVQPCIEATEKPEKPEGFIHTIGEELFGEGWSLYFVTWKFAEGKKKIKWEVTRYMRKKL